MIDGIVIDSKYLGVRDGIHLNSYIVKIPNTVHKKNSIWVSLFVTASCNDIVLGTHCVPQILHHLTKKTKSAFSRINTEFCIERAIHDADATLSLLAV